MTYPSISAEALLGKVSTHISKSYCLCPPKTLKEQVKANIQEPAYEECVLFREALYSISDILQDYLDCLHLHLNFQISGDCSEVRDPSGLLSVICDKVTANKTSAYYNQFVLVRQLCQPVRTLRKYLHGHIDVLRITPAALNKTGLPVNNINQCLQCVERLRPALVDQLKKICFNGLQRPGNSADSARRASTTWLGE